MMDGTTEHISIHSKEKLTILSRCLKSGFSCDGYQNSGRSTKSQSKTRLCALAPKQALAPKPAATSFRSIPVPTLRQWNSSGGGLLLQPETHCSRQNRKLVTFEYSVTRLQSICPALMTCLSRIDSYFRQQNKKSLFVMALSRLVLFSRLSTSEFSKMIDMLHHSQRLMSIIVLLSSNTAKPLRK